MSWASMLYQTYQSNAVNAGKEEEGISLSVIAHMYANAQVELTIDENGSFVGAREITKGSGRILIPVTEDSSNRSSGSAPHALCDTLSYIAGDYIDYVDPNVYADEKKREKNFKMLEKKHLEYMNALKKWANNETYSHKKVRAIFNYLVKNETIKDLISAGLIKIENEKFVDGKISGVVYEKALTAFRVIIAGDDSDISSAVWKDELLREKYVSYYLLLQGGNKDICYITGKEQEIAEKHPKGILAASYGAKLLSSNDKEGFTYRGRFISAGEAYSVGYESTQKIHNALTYLAAKQGIMVGTKDKRTYICWNPKGKKVEGFAIDFGFMEEGDKQPDTQAEYKKYLYDTLSGIKDNLDCMDDIVVIGLDAATTGRLSITYYNELKAKDFIDRIEYWYDSCKWFFTSFTPDGKPQQKIKSPPLKDIVRYAYGTQQERFVDVNDKLLKEQLQRLIYCMLDGHMLPRDITHYLAVRASTPMAYSRGNYERLLSVACAMIAKRHYDENKLKGDEGIMQLNLNNKDLSYLYGRLLAVLEKVERSAMDRKEEREPNAIRLQAAYVNHPFTVWKNLDTILIPYFNKLSVGSRMYYKDLIGEITSGFHEKDVPNLNRKLDETYLLGYYLQRKELNKPRKEQEKDKDEGQNKDKEKEEGM